MQVLPKLNSRKLLQDETSHMYRARLTIDKVSKDDRLGVFGLMVENERGVTNYTYYFGDEIKNSGLSGGEIAGIVVGVILGVALIAGVVFALLKKKKKKKTTRRMVSVNPGDTTGDTSM